MSEADADGIREHLSEYDYQIQSVAADADALEQLRAFQPQLVLLDTARKSFDAFDACERIKQDSIAMVLMVTSLNSLDDIERAVESGTDDFLSTPVNRVELTRRVENLLRLHDCLR
ncbi:Transcriptional regulatory protein AfsQ1 [Novipirellula artificiosorum]|uniref:Transcriptional regulatory protein AfsQ1 n=2 Tax=Novipirellula artificiosorum TaxID=2528016 RepID=A0A5C6E1T5_9BACT|nr:Transcriptional regulatory protein AfsQ1 [Novipirellula artificiosorum]